MKKILMLTAAICTCGTLAQAAAPFNGWSVGLHGGWNQDRVEVKSDEINDTKKTFNTGFAGIHFDWTKSRANAFLFGFGLNLGHGFGTPDVTVAEADGDKLSLEFKRNLYASIDARLGWNFNNKWALYGILSARAQGTKLRAKVTENGVERKGEEKSDVLYGFAPGVGFDVRLNERWSLGAQYKYYFDSSVTAKASDADNKVKFRSHNALVRVSYHF
tara:strand:- start:450 stop:1100 length:651 start_codon:yes stop_codon:yes gene_type:complete